jgi:serine/threonine protein phosphatase PrpC
MKVRVIGTGERKTFEVVSFTLKTDPGELWLLCADGKHAVIEVQHVEIEVSDSLLPPMGSWEIQRMLDGSPLVAVN